MKRLICYIKAIPLWLRTGLFVPHLYEATTEDAIIIATDNSFRVADNYNHSEDEVIYPNAIVERCKCVFCGHKTMAWYASKEDLI
jgi:hypothetical protein